MKRRDFIKLGSMAALSGLGMGSMSARAASADFKAAVCIYLAGGCDANNLVIPNSDTGYGQYQRARQALAIDRAALLPITTRNGSAYGLHPAMKELQSLYGQGRLAILANVGTLMKPTTKDQATGGAWPLPDNLLSHIDQQNQWCMLNPIDHNALTGWGGRMADALTAKNTAGHFPPVVSAAGSTLFCDPANVQSTAVDPYGDAGIPGNSGNDVDSARMTALRQILSDTANPSLQGAYRQAMVDAMAEADIVNTAFGTNLATQFPQTDLGQQLYRVAQLIASRGQLGLSRQVFYVELDGFDTHSDQLSTHDQLLPELSQAMAAFYQATVELGVAQNVVTFTHSEFSRTLKPAGDDGSGSDHAWGGHSFILGGGVRGGDMYGTFPQLLLEGPDDMTDEGRWVPTTSVDQYAATIATWMGVSSADLATVLPNLSNFSLRNLGFMS